MTGVLANGEDVQDVRKRGTAKTDAENFITLWGKNHTAISLGIVPVCCSLGPLPVTKATVLTAGLGSPQGSLDVCWLCWNVQGESSQSDLGRSPAGAREADRGWSDRSPALGQPFRAGACSLPGPSV